MNLKNKLVVRAKRAKYALVPGDIRQRFVFKDVPYFSQWESRELNKQILDRVIDTEDDPRWRQSGAKTSQEYAEWSWVGCGMACTKMLMAHKTGRVIPLIELGKKCAAHGGYTYPLIESQGLRYAPYRAFMRAEFDVDARPVVPLIQQEIMRALSDEKYVIASVSPDIRVAGARPKHKGGHLILLLGYDLDKQEFYFHNPSGVDQKTQEYAAISFAEFDHFFSGRGIVVL